jgi:biotin-(acetyl-CoA carboxylase) ligase
MKGMGEVIFTYEQDFHDLNLIAAREKAINFYQSIDDGWLRRGNWKMAGQLKVKCILVETTEKGKQRNHFIGGAGIDANYSGRKFELAVIKKATGIDLSVIYPV